MSKRPYTLKRRAEQQAETRQRIVEATVALHSTLGPSRSPLSLIAERAGVQRHTLYAHFPDERSLVLACSGHAFDRDPPPDAEPWRAIADRGERLAAGLAEIHSWYARNAEMLVNVLRDAEHMPIVREVSALHMGPRIAGWHAVLDEGLAPAQQAMLALMLSFPSWRTLTQEAGLAPEAAVALAVQAILGATAT